MMFETLLPGREEASLKRIARNAYTDYYRIAEGYSCGLALAEEISVAMRHAKVAFNNAMDELAQIDPTCPKQRL